MLLLSDPKNETIFRSLIQDTIEHTGEERTLPAQKADLILANILRSDEAVILPMKKRISTRAWMRSAAAVILVVAGALSYRLLFREHQLVSQPIVAKVLQPVTISPGTDKALLTMANGKTVVLDSIQNGTLSQQGDVAIQKQQGSLIYAAAGNSNTAMEYNTLTVPRGGQYHLVLSDGSQVWLNAASSLRFPVAFTGNTREVEMTGEAYFEIAKNKDKPFHVKANATQVEVLGTHFNVNAYEEEQAIKTSLLEGSVRVSNGSFSNRIKPGEQAAVNNKNGGIDVATADMDAVMAWKNGLFEFQGADIATIMRQVARWYDVEIVFAGKTPARKFEGKISRNAQLPEVLKILELSNIQFRVEGKKIIVQ